MKFSVRTAKVDDIKSQLLTLDESAVTPLNSIRNIEALLIDEPIAQKLLKPTTNSDAPSLKLLDSVDEREYYEHLCQLLHIHNYMRDK